MKTIRSFQILLLSATFAGFLSACGPKDISTDFTEDEPIRTSVSTAEQMRFPHFGSDANQRMLFMQNRMDHMTVRQKVIHSQIRNSFARGTDQPVQPEPKQASPFRQ